MSSVALFELLAALCAGVAALFLFDQHLYRPRPYKLAWTLGLFCYVIAAGAAFVGEWRGWSAPTYSAWYYFGGILTAAYLGLGSLFLLGPRWLARIVAVVMVALSLYAAARILLYPIPQATLAAISSATTAQITNVRDFSVFPADVRAIAVVMNITGATLLFGGAAWSAWSLWRRHGPRYRLVSMALLALGAVFPSILTGAQALGYSAAAALGEFLGAVCLLAGLLISLDVFTVFRIPFTHIVLRERRPVTASAPSVERS
jgi:hypothetical protein